MTADGSTAIGRLTPDGQQDGAFGGTGNLRLYNGPRPMVIVQGDGKLLIVSNDGRDLTLSRYDVNGDLDPTFGNNGQATIDLGAPVYASSLAIERVGGADELLVGGTIAISAATPELVSTSLSNGFVARVLL